MPAVAPIESPAAIPGNPLPSPPGPRGQPIFGSLFHIVADPIGAFMDGVRQYGPVVRYRVGPHRLLLLDDAEAALHVLQKNHHNYHKSPSYAGLELVLGKGLVTSEGDLWRRQRKLVQPAFRRRVLERMACSMADRAEDLVQSWRRRGFQRVDIHEEMMALTLRIAGETLFSADMADDTGPMGDALGVVLPHARRYAESILRPPPWFPTPANLRFRKSLGTLDAVVQRLIDDRRALGADDRPADLLQLLLEATDEGGAMDDRQLRDEVMTLILAGHETTANALTWIWVLLSRHPEAARRLVREVDEVVGDGAVTFAALRRLEFTHWVVQEAMRLYPPVWIVERQALAEDSVLGYRIAKGDIVAACPYTLHRNPRYWTNPEGFDPDRFRGGLQGSAKHAFMPFGAGPRICVGKEFAMMEAVILLATLARTFRLDLVPGQRIEMDAGITLRPKGKVEVEVHPRARMGAA